MKKCFSLFILFIVTALSANGQFAPQVGLAGSTAISATSSLFYSWAGHCSVQYGYLNIADPSLGHAGYGDSTKALGPADGQIVSLGDSGVATLTFGNLIINGPGPDFAVFENGFRNGADSAQAYLELGFVEVSSDGVHFFRFPSTSLTPLDMQVSNTSYMDASLVNNLAGKYVASYGTPFDLEELTGIIGLDVNHITHIRIVDVVGSIGSHSSHDNFGHVINDPYPSPFPSGGFDLDAVGIINETFANVHTTPQNEKVSVYPNPATDHISITKKGSSTDEITAVLTSATGVVLNTIISTSAYVEISLVDYPQGFYFLSLTDANGNKWTEKIIRN